MSTRSLAPDHPDYPPALSQLGKAPPILYLRGELPSATGVAVVGTRRASPAALAFTRRLVHDLAARGLAIWSGGAIGIDAAAHHAALEAHAPTVVVVGGGLDMLYPAQNLRLFDRVLEQGGALLSRAPAKAAPVSFRFHQRNELLAALTAATIVVEAGEQSGARSTASAARRLSRPLCVVPHPPWSRAGLGCALELVLGAHPVVSADDVLAAMGLAEPRSPARRPHHEERATQLLLGALAMPAQMPQKVAVLPEMSEAESQVFRVLEAEPAHIDQICERTGLSFPSVAEALLTLTLRSIVVEGPAGLYQRALSP